MAYCRNCGTQLNENQDVCLNCGTFQNQDKTNENTSDNGGFGWGLLGFCIPIVGLILFLIWKDERPNTAKAVGIGALVGFGLNLLGTFGIVSSGILSMM